jgi:hypothetical protein
MRAVSGMSPRRFASVALAWIDPVTVAIACIALLIDRSSASVSLRAYSVRKHS